VKFTPGKLAGMKAVSDNRGVIAAAAMDQRGSLQKALAKEKGGSVGDHDIEPLAELGVILDRRAFRDLDDHSRWVFHLVLVERRIIEIVRIDVDEQKLILLELVLHS